VNEPPDEPHILLANLPPTRGQRRLALAIAVALVVAFVVMVPFAKIELPPINAFIPTLETALLINDLLTSALLFAQFSILHQRALLALASGYLFTALIIIPHALTFPGAYSPTGLLGAGSQSSAWLYIFWHAGLPLAVIIYARLKEADHGPSIPKYSPRAAIALSVAIVTVLVCVLTGLAINEERLLPRLLPDATHVTLWGQYLTGSLVLLSVLALMLLWLHRRSVLDLWLMVMICALLPEAAITAFLSATSSWRRLSISRSSNLVSLVSMRSIFASSWSARRSRRVSSEARSSLVAICLTTWASISPISLRLVFFGAICRKYSTPVGRRRQIPGFGAAGERSGAEYAKEGRPAAEVVGDRFANRNPLQMRRWQAMDLQNLRGVMRGVEL